MKIQIYDKTKKRKFIEKLENLGIKNIPGLLVKTGSERIRVFSGSLSNDEIWKIWRMFPVEGIGLYLGKELADGNVRLSLDALHLLKSQINKRIIKLNKEQTEKWFKGNDVDVNDEQINDIENGFVAVKYKDDFIGTGNLNKNMRVVYCFLPKERRVRN